MQTSRGMHCFRKMCNLSQLATMAIEHHLNRDMELSYPSNDNPKGREKYINYKIKTTIIIDYKIK